MSQMQEEIMKICGNVHQGTSKARIYFKYFHRLVRQDGEIYTCYARKVFKNIFKNIFENITCFTLDIGLQTTTLYGVSCASHHVTHVIIPLRTIK